MADLYPIIPDGYAEPEADDEYYRSYNNIYRYPNVYPLTVTRNVSSFEEMLQVRGISLTDDETQRSQIREDLTNLQSLGGYIGCRVEYDPIRKNNIIHFFADGRLNTAKYFDYYPNRHPVHTIYGTFYDNLELTAAPMFSVREYTDGSRSYACLGLVFWINSSDLTGAYNNPAAPNRPFYQTTDYYTAGYDIYNYADYGVEGTSSQKHVWVYITTTIEYSYYLNNDIIGNDYEHINTSSGKHTNFNEVIRGQWVEDGGFYDTGVLVNLTGNDYYFKGAPVIDGVTNTPNSCGLCDQMFAYNTETGEMLELLDSGFINVYTTFSDGTNFANTAMNELSAAMWTTGLFSGNEDNHRLSSIVSVSLFPEIPEYNSTAEGVQCGDELLSVGMQNNAYIFPVTKQFSEFDLGSIEVARHFNNFLDFEPYSKMQLYMPFIGIRDVDINEFMGGTISLQYIIDYISGNVTVHVHSNLHPARPLYIFNGSCSVPVPITGDRQDAMIRNQIQNTVGVVAGVAGAVGSSFVGNIGGTAAGLAQAATAGVNLEMSHPQILRSGSLSGNAGYMGDYGEYSPFIIISRPTKDYTPDYYSHVRGFTSYEVNTLGNLSGYTQVHACRVNNMTATQTEKDEIEQLLQNGVIL